MKDRIHLLATAVRLRSESQPFALATVVKINGSTYRRPGARMLVEQDGTTHGIISGGCLEGEVAQQAVALLNGGTPQVLPFDLTDDDLILGFGTGCNGIVHVLIEPMPTPGRTDPTQLLDACLRDRYLGVLATIIDAPDGSDLLARRLLLRDDGNVYGDLPDAKLRDTILTKAPAVRAEGRHQIQTIATDEGNAEVLFEIVQPPVRLVIFGTGHDVHPVVRIAKELGWPVTIVGRKPPEALAERFPDADEHRFLMHPEEVNQQVPIDARSAAVVMNHNYLRDKTLVGALLTAPVPYVGALGPHERTERMLAELQAENPSLPDVAYDKVHGPVGLDIGTETPEEIALSIIAEIQAVHHNREGGMLRHRHGAIHEPVKMAG
jgi:xanthine/CO dehydrogenase XdhC/CoxF family maturation factor